MSKCFKGPGISIKKKDIEPKVLDYTYKSSEQASKE